MTEPTVTKKLFTFRDLLKKTWEVYRKNWKKLTLAVLTSFTTAALLGVGMAIAIFLVKQISMEANEMVGMTLMAFILIAGIIAISVIMNAILCFSAIQAVKENIVSIKESLKIAFKKFWKMLSVILRIMVYAWGWFVITIVIGLIVFFILNVLLSSSNTTNVFGQNNSIQNASAKSLLDNAGWSPHRLEEPMGPSDMIMPVESGITNERSPEMDWITKMGTLGIGGLVVGILTFIFGIITFIFGGYRAIRAHFSLQALLESNKTPKEALETSKQVTKKNFWRICGYYGFLSIITTLPMIAIIIVINMLISSQTTEEIIGGIAQFIFSMIMTSFVAIWRYLFFKGLEEEKNLTVQTPSA